MIRADLRKPGFAAAVSVLTLLSVYFSAVAAEVRYFPVPARTHPHDVTAASDGTVRYTAQRSGHLGVFDPKTGKTEHFALGKGSSPHGINVGPGGAARITDSGQNAIVRVESATEQWKSYPSNQPDAQVRQMLGRPGEAWGAESGRDRRLVVVRE